MSDTNASNNSSTNGMSGRTLSLARRKAMSVGGKSAIAKTNGKPNGAQGVQAKPQPPAARPAPPAARPTMVSRPALAARIADTAVIANNKPAEEDCGCEHTAEQQALEALCSLDENDSASLGSGAVSVRQLCQARRKGLSNQGKTVLGRRKERSAGDGKRLGSGINASNGLSGRAAARARREALCIEGRGDSPACRPSGRVRSTSTDAPAKVEVGNTLSGNTVTGTQVERSSKVTGILAGSCLAVTGTEYIGMEQYSKLCSTVPAPAPAKVGSGSTSRGQRISGTELGRSEHVTGDEIGAGKRVTGNEYLSAEQFESISGSKPAPGPAKVGQFSTQAGLAVSGTSVGRSTKVTGDEPGACLKLTGSQYDQPDGNICQGSGVPHKVSVMKTVHERPVTGTNVAASAAVTGSEYGACSTVTGIEYAGLEQYQACGRAPVMTPEKVAMSRTWRDQTISGTAIEHSSKVTGDEYGGCQPISGTEYIGSGQYSANCAPGSLSAAQGRVATRRGAAGESTTGVGNSENNKVTGSARSSAIRLSGSAYSDDAKYALPGHAVSGAVGMSQHPLSRGPADRNNSADRSRIAVASAVAPVQSNFSITPPARAAQASQLNRVTGTATSAQGRITGPVNLAVGLVSGTPEFRYREESFAAPVASTPEKSVETQGNRVTGEGREAGFAITGAAWRRDGSTTGTEGVSAARRNPTIRGDARGMAMQTLASKAQEPVVQAPPSRVTGSSGNTAAGSTITYSGGARG